MARCIGLCTRAAGEVVFQQHTCELQCWLICSNIYLFNICFQHSFIHSWSWMRKCDIIRLNRLLPLLNHNPIWLSMRISGFHSTWGCEEGRRQGWPTSHPLPAIPHASYQPSFARCHRPFFRSPIISQSYHTETLNLRLYKLLQI